MLNLITTSFKTFAMPVLLLLCMIFSHAATAKDAELWDFWSAHDAQSTATIDHTAWSDILQTYIKPDGDLHRFAYSSVSAADKQKLANYVQSLENTQIRQYNRAEQKAYWINLYNAQTILTVLNHYPVDSIRDIDISPGLFSNGPWDKELLSIEGQDVSLNDIEHRILRPIWDTPLTHYTINCASVGCPNLATQAFTADNLESQQVQLAKAYINSPRGVQVDGGDITVSKIYDWFVADFGGNEAQVIKHLQQYANEDLAQQLAGQTSIDDYEYDWSLNE